MYTELKTMQAIPQQAETSKQINSADEVIVLPNREDEGFTSNQLGYHLRNLNVPIFKHDTNYLDGVEGTGFSDDSDTDPHFDVPLNSESDSSSDFSDEENVRPKKIFENLENKTCENKPDPRKPRPK